MTTFNTASPLAVLDRQKPSICLSSQLSLVDNAKATGLVPDKMDAKNRGIRRH